MQLSESGPQQIIQWCFLEKRGSIKSPCCPTQSTNSLLLCYFSSFSNKMKYSKLSYSTANLQAERLHEIEVPWYFLKTKQKILATQRSTRISQQKMLNMETSVDVMKVTSTRQQVMLLGTRKMVHQKGRHSYQKRKSILLDAIIFHKLESFCL